MRAYKLAGELQILRAPLTPDVLDGGLHLPPTHPRSDRSSLLMQQQRRARRCCVAQGDSVALREGRLRFRSRGICCPHMGLCFLSSSLLWNRSLKQMGICTLLPKTNKRSAVEECGNVRTSYPLPWKHDMFFVYMQLISGRASALSFFIGIELPVVFRYLLI